MKKHEIVYRSYKRYHKGDNCLELEEGKVIRDNIKADKNTKQVTKQLEKLLDRENIMMKDEDIENLNNSLYAEIRTKKNSKTHKNRFYELKKNIDFK